MQPKIVRVAVLRFLWPPGPAVSGALPSLTWPDEFYEQLFQAHNNWSIRDYWLRSSFGLLQLEFDFSLAHWWRFGDFDQASTSSNRNGILDDARQIVEADSPGALDRFDQIIAFVHAPPSNAGARSLASDAVLDQNAIIPFYQHEVGHMLGFEHAYGPFVPPPSPFGNVYNDPYDVMGYTNLQAHSISTPAEFANIQSYPGKNLWLSERRPSAAALYRRFTGTPQFVQSGWVEHANLGDRVWVAALSEAVNTVPVIAVIPVPGSNDGVVTVEYRTATNDDAGVTPAVVIHTIGVHPVPAGRGEVNPPWFEGTVTPSVGSSFVAVGLRFQVMTVATGSVAGVEVLIEADSPQLHGQSERRLIDTSVARADALATPVTAAPKETILHPFREEDERLQRPPH
jgi:hypothetical protein